MRKPVLAVVAAMLSAAAPALAQDAAPFTGLRAEGLIGWDRSQAFGGHEDGAMYGAAVGYDLQLNGFLAGAEGEISDSTVKQCEGPSGDRLCAKAGRDLYLGGRIGTVIGGTVLLYGKAGYTNARYSVSYNGASEGANFDGLRLGAGAEYAIGPNSFVKAEYRYSNYEDDLSRHQLAAGFGFRF
jgi:outer membrane immunogenic protein